MRAGIAFGSNLGDRLAHLKRARGDVLRIPAAAGLLAASRIYETEPVHSGPDAAAYLNAVIEIEYHGEPVMLLDALQKIESDFGRPSKRPRNAPRAIDLDLLYAGNISLSSDEAMIPHPRLHLRRFVLAPLAEIRPELIIPGQELPIWELLARLGDPAAVALYPGEWQ